jgi:hypothetical protein
MRSATADTRNDLYEVAAAFTVRAAKGDLLLEILVDEPIFIGFKAGRAIRHLLESFDNTENEYFSSEDSTFLRRCRIGEDVYVGKLISEALATDRVDDVRRNILSILRKLGPTVPLPTTLKIFSCRAVTDISAVERPSCGLAE